MEKEITIGGKTYKAKMTALTVRKYRSTFGSDMIADLTRSVGKKGEIQNTAVYEQLAWLSLKDAGEDVGESVEAWLETLSMADLIELVVAIAEFWAENQRTTSTP